MMDNQIVIDFPELDQETYERLLKITRDIKVFFWDGEERKRIPLKWDGTRICCPITIWFDFPDSYILTKYGVDE